MDLKLYMVDVSLTVRWKNFKLGMDICSGLVVQCHGVSFECLSVGIFERVRWKKSLVLKSIIHLGV